MNVEISNKRPDSVRQLLSASEGPEGFSISGMRFQISDLFISDKPPALLRGHSGSLRQDDEQAGKTTPMQCISGQAVGADNTLQMLYEKCLLSVKSLNLRMIWITKNTLKGTRML